MAAATRSASLSLNWSKILSGLHLKGATANSLTAFKSRNDEARRRILALSSQPQDVDFAHYRSILGNQAIVDEIEKAVKSYEVKKVDVSRQLKALEAFEAQAVKSAEETKVKVDEEVGGLQQCLKDIESVRAWEEISVDDVFKALPETEKHMEEKIRRGIWSPPPGYWEKFGDPSIM